jgi:thioredoxin reductase (NADPH)
MFGERYRVVRSDNGPAALDALRELTLRGEATAVILSDYRMPGMTGVDFLERAMDLVPRAKAGTAHRLCRHRRRDPRHQ